MYLLVWNHNVVHVYIRISEWPWGKTIDNPVLHTQLPVMKLGSSGKLMFASKLLDIVMNYEITKPRAKGNNN